MWTCFSWRTIPPEILPLAHTMRSHAFFSPRTKEEINLEALPTKEGMQVGVLLFRPDDKRILELKGAADARALFEVRVGYVCYRQDNIGEYVRTRRFKLMPAVQNVLQLTCFSHSSLRRVSFWRLSTLSPTRPRSLPPSRRIPMCCRNCSPSSLLWSRTRPTKGLRCRRFRGCLPSLTRDRFFTLAKARLYSVNTPPGFLECGGHIWICCVPSEGRCHGHIFVLSVWTRGVLAIW